MILPSMLFALCAGATLVPQAEEPQPARYVRIELPGAARILSLAEVQLFFEGVTLGEGGKAKQSSVASGGEPERAIDGKTDGVYTNGSVTHTSAERNPWWELDLGEEQVIDRIVVWNRTDCCAERLKGFTLQLLDKRHRLVWERVGIPAPSPTQEIIPFTEAPPPPVVVGPTPEERRELQPRIDEAIDAGVEFLLSRQLWDGSFQQHSAQYPSGSTGLALYALLKCQLPRDHPAVARAVEYIHRHPPTETYEIGIVLMALAALDDPAEHEFMEVLLAELLDYQGARAADGKRDGLWAYPRHSEVADLSNSQYGALGLRAAQQAGLNVPKRAWTSLATGVVRYQEEPRLIDDATRQGTTSGKQRIAGFPYRIGSAASSSMTTAGLGILGICKEALVDVPSTLRRKLQVSEELARAWLAYNFSVETNVGGGQNWRLYYLYGLERVGALLGIDEFGGHDWYWEGAKSLVPGQAGNGSWSTDNEADTCFALLFLSRATAKPNTGVKATAGGPDGTWISEGDDLDVQWRITGGNQATFFISGFAEALEDELALGTGSTRGLRIQTVEYRVDGTVIASLPGDVERKWTGERFAARHQFNARGSYTCAVHVQLQVPGEVAGITSTRELVGEALLVEIKDAHDSALLEYPRHSATNLLRNTQLSVKASTVNGPGQEAGKAVDGLLGTSWMSKADDGEPQIVIDLARPQRGSVLLFSQANPNSVSRGIHDHATRVRVTLNGKQSFEVEAPAGDEAKCRLELDQVLSLRQIEITILERTPGTKYPGHVGIGEIEWLGGK